MKHLDQNSFLTVLGTMSGTSMDGIDISIIETNGKTIKRCDCNLFFYYSKKTTDYLNIAYENQDLILKNKKFKRFLDELVTIDHLKVINNAIDKYNIKIDLVGFHGQTIYHDFESKTSIQLGNPQLLSSKLKTNVISNFRKNDLLKGGQGAPISPIYHKLLIEEFKLSLPSCIINIGGVSNITYWDGQKLLGFDTGPGNGFMDYYLQSTSDILFDKGGQIASLGKPNINILNEFLEDDFFSINPPKSLDRKYFKKYYNKLIEKKLNKYDMLATLAHMTSESIVKSIDCLPKHPNSISIVGGGAKNINLINLLKNKINTNFIELDKKKISIDFIESEMIAYITVRSLFNLPITFPGTTGTKKNISGGELFLPL